MNLDIHNSLARVALSAVEAFKQKPFTCLAQGFLAQFLIFSLTLFLLISIFGIPIIPLVLFLGLIFILIGLFCCAASLGSIFPIKGTQNLWQSFFLGLILLEIMVFIPIVGLIIDYIFLTMGFGAVIRVAFPLIPLLINKKNRVLDSSGAQLIDLNDAPLRHSSPSNYQEASKFKINL